MNRLNGLLAFSSGVAHCASQAGRTIVVSQGISVDSLQETVRRLRPTTNLGIGIPQRGLPGAVTSLVDAAEALARALAVAHDVRFEEQWLAATVAANTERLRPILSRGWDVAAQYPALAETLSAYLENSFSVSRCC